MIAVMELDPGIEDLDSAIETAAARTVEAEEQLLAEPTESPDLVPKAEIVVHRAEDLDELAIDALAATDEDASRSS